MFREGFEPPKAPAPPRYEPVIPAGFEKLAHQGTSWVSHDKNNEYGGHGESTVAMFDDHRHGVRVTIDVLDPDELDPSGDAAAWGARVASRLFVGVPLGTAAERAKLDYQAYGEPGARALSLHRQDHGCEDIETFDRVAERDGGLLHVEVESTGLLSRKRVAALVRTFIDDPLGAAPAKAAIKKARKRKRSK